MPGLNRPQNHSPEDSAVPTAAQPPAGETAGDAASFRLNEPSEAEKQEMASPPAEGGSLLQRLIRMSVPERVRAALTGSRDERLLLIRDQNRMVLRAVIQSPQTNDRDAEVFAAMGNIGEEALRLLASERRFRLSARLPLLLVQNPHCPLDVSLELLKHLASSDLQKLTRNRMIGEQARRAAERELKRRKGR